LANTLKCDITILPLNFENSDTLYPVGYGS
jgi:hypothetical protein